MTRHLYHLNLLNIAGEHIGVVSRHSYLPRHAFLAHYQAKVSRGRLGRYVNSVSFKVCPSDDSIPASLTIQAY